MPRSTPSAPGAPLSDNARGALWLLVSVAGATAMTIGVREVSGEIHSVMLAFLRSVLATLAVLPILLLRRRSYAGRLRFTRPWLHVARGVSLCFALNGGFYAIWQLPLATAAVLFFLSPVFATLLAGPVLGERVGPRRWAAVGAGFLGAVVILRPGIEPPDWAMLAALVSALAFALALLVGRMASDADGTDAVFVSSTLLVPFGTLPPALFFWDLPVTPWAWAMTLVLVAASSLRTYSDIRAYGIGEAGFLAPFTYLRLLTVGAAGYMLYDETIDGGTLVGGAVIVGATLYIAFRESRTGRGRGGAGAP